MKVYCIFRAILIVVHIGGIECVEFKNNGYELVVAIHRDTPENLNIISELQTMLTSASDYLYTTTRKYTYIRRVTILVPDTWGRQSSWKDEGEITFTDADIRVDSSHPAWGNTPYTFQPGQCGEPGRYILLTSEYVLDNGINRVFNYGDAGRTLVHEFAHLRFGVFDEYGIPGSDVHPVGYIDDTSTTLRPTACSTDITGDFVDVVKDAGCAPVSTTKLLNDDCAFLPSSYMNRATSSVMYAQFLKEVVNFCESNPESGRLDLKHNPNAPNRHNKMCNERGTWDIIREHPDIKGRNPVDVSNRNPQFSVVYRQKEAVGNTTVCGRRFVFVLDVSGSMTGNNRYFRLRQMADKVIRDVLPEGTEAGIVVFSSRASVMAPMRFITSPSDREALTQELPQLQNFGGSTAIGLGLLKAIELLESNAKSAENGRIFLITDGGENVNPSVRSIWTNITRKQVVVHTVAYSDDAAPILRPLSELTGGQYSFFDESSSSTALEGAAERLLEDVSVCEQEADSAVEIDRHAILLNSALSTYERTILIDSTIGNNTLFVFTLSILAQTEVSIKDPLGNVQNQVSPTYSKDKALNIIRFLIPLAQAGRWTYSLKRGSNSDESVVGVVKSHPRVGALPYEVETWISSKEYNYSAGSGVVLYTYTHQGYSPIIRAKVDVTVSRAGEAPFNVTLEDNGRNPDNTANDGVYSNYLLGFKSNSRYSMEVRVESVEGQTVIIKAGNALSGRALSVYQNSTAPVVYEPVDGFSRTTSPGAIDIQGYDPLVDQLDPGRVTDLDISVVNRNRRTIAITWTATGDDLNVGTVSKYDIRVSSSFDALRQNFTASYEISNSNILSGSLTALQSGSQQMVQVALPSDQTSNFHVIGLRAVDDSNRTSLISNLRSVTFQAITIPQRTTTTTTTTQRAVTTPTSPRRGPSLTYKPSDNNTLIFGIAFGVGAALIILLIMIMFIVCIIPGREHVSTNSKHVSREAHVAPMTTLSKVPQYARQNYFIP
ncbi:calcium-activated chloride channel regulator 1-like [Haliotis rufescens]|uniref:calcium-activated chloride channel regulator 1-like n=1 Tax=Haliotis rufescens TaxID=6454 RepID=UPI00201F0717|nr:calcium-activated chloride channel regulator 1-like [Haliotis rufescens]